MRYLLALLLLLGLATAGCNTMPEDDPGYDVRLEQAADTPTETTG